jgi:parvulin-like peptidyl-prolyl isomerase
MESLDIIKAIHFLKPNAEFSFTETDYSTIKWDVLEGAAPTWEEVQAAHLQVKAAEEAALAEAEAKKQALLDRLGITAEEARLLLS